MTDSTTDISVSPGGPFESAEPSPVEAVVPARLEPVCIGRRRSSLSGRHLRHLDTRICHRTGAILDVGESFSAEDGFEFRPAGSGGILRRLRLRPPHAPRPAWLPEPGHHRPGLALRGTVPWWPAALSLGGLIAAWGASQLAGTGIGSRLGAGPAMTTALDAVAGAAAGPLTVISAGGLVIWAAGGLAGTGHDRRRRRGPLFAPDQMKVEIVWTQRESLAIDGPRAQRTADPWVATLAVKARPEPRDAGPLGGSRHDATWNAGWLVIDTALVGGFGLDHPLLPSGDGRAVPLLVPPPAPPTGGEADRDDPAPGRPSIPEFSEREWMTIVEADLVAGGDAGAPATSAGPTAPSAAAPPVDIDAAGLAAGPAEDRNAFVDPLDPFDPPLARGLVGADGSGSAAAAPVDRPGGRLRVQRRLDAPAWLEIEHSVVLAPGAAPTRIDHAVTLALDDVAAAAGLRFVVPGPHGRVQDEGRSVVFAAKTTGADVSRTAAFAVYVSASGPAVTPLVETVRGPEPATEPGSIDEPAPWSGRFTGTAKLTVHGWTPGGLGAGPEDISLFLPTGTPRAIDDRPETEDWPKQAIKPRTVFESDLTVVAASISRPRGLEIEVAPRLWPADPAREGASVAVQALADALGAAGVAVLDIEHRLPAGVRPAAGSGAAGAGFGSDDGTWEVRCVAFEGAGAAPLVPVEIELRLSVRRSRRSADATGSSDAPALEVAGEVRSSVHDEAGERRLRAIAARVDGVLGRAPARRSGGFVEIKDGVADASGAVKS